MRCKATSKTTGKQCGKSAMRGGLVCRSHGGAAGQVKAAAARNLTEQEIRRLWAQTDHAPVDDPLTELAKLAGEILSWKSLLKDKVGELVALGYRGATSEQIQAEVTLYQAAVTQLSGVLTSIARLNIDSRLVAISEKQGELVIAALEAGLDAAGVDHAGRFVAKQAAARHLELARGAA
jgi:hypothetical protein